jgi:hypothetical protein
VKAIYIAQVVRKIDRHRKPGLSAFCKRYLDIVPEKLEAKGGRRIVCNPPLCAIILQWLLHGCLHETIPKHDGGSIQSL